LAAINVVSAPVAASTGAVFPTDADGSIETVAVPVIWIAATGTSVKS
jgi:hypothetical protein